MTINNPGKYGLIKTLWLSPQLRNILILSLLIVLIFPIYSLLVDHPKYIQLLISFVEEDASRISQHLSKPLIEQKHLLQQGALPEEFTQSVRELQTDFGLEKVKVFDSKGEILFSTSAKDIGQLNKKSYFHQIVAAGKNYSKIVHKSQPSAEGRVVDRDVIETYSPIMDKGVFIGAFELYYDVTLHKSKLDKLLTSSTIDLLAMAFLLISGILIVQIKSAAIVQSRNQALLALQASEARFRNMSSSAQDAIIEMDETGNIAFWNKAAERIFGFNAEQAKGQNLHRLLAPQRFYKAFDSNYEVFKQSGEGPIVGQTTEFVGLHKSGYEFPLEISIAKIDSDNGFKAIAILRDISQRKETERRMKLGASVISHTQQGVIITDASGKIQAVNPAFVKITGYSSDEVMGKNPRLLKSDKHDKNFYKRMWDSLLEIGSWEGEIWNCRKNGELFPEWLSLNVIKNSDGTIANHVGIFSDIKVLKDAEQELELLAFYDSLTGLANRILFNDRINQAIKQCKRERDLCFAILYLDLDYFKQVNDTHGHDVGDVLLQETAKRLIHCVREVDTVARLGGDEFSIVLTKLKETDICETIADKIIEALNEPFYPKDIQCHIGTSIGIAIYPTHSQDPEVLIEMADKAMYQAKSQGRNQFCFTHN